MKRLALLVLLGGCSIADEPYPVRWDPLPLPSSSDCRHFRGFYADRGESSTSTLRPSLSRELFGEDGPWEKAVSVELDPGDDTLDIRVAVPGSVFTRRLTRAAGEFACDRGRLMVHSKRWIYSDLMSGRESVTIEMHRADPHLVARVDELTTGVMFLVVPLSGESARWFRFQRLRP